MDTLKHALHRFTQTGATLLLILVLCGQFGISHMVIGQPESTQTALSSNAPSLAKTPPFLLRHPTPSSPTWQSTRQQTKHQVDTDSQTTHALTVLIMLALAFVLAYIPDLKHTHRWSNSMFIAIALCGYGQRHAQVWQAPLTLAFICVGVVLWCVVRQRRAISPLRSKCQGHRNDGFQPTLWLMMIGMIGLGLMVYQINNHDIMADRGHLLGFWLRAWSYGHWHAPHPTAILKPTLWLISAGLYGYLVTQTLYPKRCHVAHFDHGVARWIIGLLLLLPNLPSAVFVLLCIPLWVLARWYLRHPIPCVPIGIAISTFLLQAPWSMQIFSLFSEDLSVAHAPFPHPTMTSGGLCLAMIVMLCCLHHSHPNQPSTLMRVQHQTTFAQRKQTLFLAFILGMLPWGLQIVKHPIHAPLSLFSHQMVKDHA